MSLKINTPPPPPEKLDSHLGYLTISSSEDSSDDDHHHHTENVFTRREDHPEPELLASSVGKNDVNGKLIPSSSTISLLSLNHQELSSPKLMHASSSQQQQQQPPQPQPVAQPILLRKNSELSGFSNLQRLSTYSKLASPLSHLPHPNTTAAVEFAGFQSLQAASAAAAAAPQSASQVASQAPQAPPGSIPNSPYLNPTSLGGSPSRFWLSNQEITIASGRYQVKVTKSRNNQQQQPVPTQTRNNRPPVSGGDSSPMLNPVQTPLEDPPMTPLFLNNKPQDYFTNHYSHRHQRELQEDEGFSQDESQSEYGKNRDDEEEMEKKDKDEDEELDMDIS
ncbi:uncharacterized protein LODBEIA_P32630 [Lodderomyces beijingensis]|uniref:Uncharacterized protein n=1 Tax=Lodderomyces beijingensis TaxID=1775926 RepID=A0ABP0ZLM6_9ASCO